MKTKSEKREEERQKAITKKQRGATFSGQIRKMNTAKKYKGKKNSSKFPS